jgi:four helix bundle protein
MENLIIYQRVYDLMIYLFPIIDRFPRHEKFVLCTELKNCILIIARKIVRANKSRNKRPILYDIDVAIEEVRLLIRFAHDRKYLSHKSYEETSKRINEIGRLLGGWLKSAG